jgi:ribosomal protein S18 acetylase RimI-like enzyme
VTAPEWERIRTFGRDLARRTTRRTEPFPWGTAYLDDRFPVRWDSNLLWIEGSLDGASADDLADEADRILGAAGLTHRQVLIDDDAAAERLAGGFAERGYHRDRLLAMVLRRGSDRGARTPVREVDADTFVPIVEAATRREEPATSDAVVRQLAGFRRVVAQDLGARFFVADADGVPAARAELYASDGVAQIEDVGTLSEYRGRGLASAVVLHAIAEARALGADLVFLHADDADWPKDWYAKLGFDGLARWSAFQRDDRPTPDRD